jgi:hypothetical protein
MSRHGSQQTRASFVLRVIRDRHGRISGVIERVATGAKETFQGVEAIGPVIAGMLARKATNRLAGADARDPPGKARFPAE